MVGEKTTICAVFLGGGDGIAEKFCGGKLFVEVDDFAVDGVGFVYGEQAAGGAGGGA